VADVTLRSIPRLELRDDLASVNARNLYQFGELRFQRGAGEAVDRLGLPPRSTRVLPRSTLASMVGHV
jgi:hypothetical protein